MPPRDPTAPPELERYRIGALLGRGGMGNVYRAVRTQDGREVAIKTMRLPDRALLTNLRREIRALGRLHHPGVVRILDDGVTEEGLPWYAMELVVGYPLRQVIGTDATPTAPTSPVDGSASTGLDWWTESLAGPPTPPGDPDRPPPPAARQPAVDLPRVLSLIERLCPSLAFIHGEGIVHRDLKPDNIVIRPDGGPVLVDFGLVTQFGARAGRERIESAFEVAGTALYMAPEQIEGSLVDARADLYALGCVIYELLTGRPPFVADSEVAVTWKHMQEEPKPPSRLVASVPAELDRLVLALLAKDPHDRIGYASDVAAILRDLGADPTTVGPPARPYLYRPRLAGRKTVLERADAGLERVGKGAAEVILIGGESGVGKTRLALELMRRAHQRGISVVVGDSPPAPEQGLAGPLQPFRAVLRELADRHRTRSAVGPPGRLGTRGALLAPFEPSLARIAAEEGVPPPAELPPTEARTRLVQALTEVLSILAGHRPLLLVLDDLQWCDDLSLHFLDQLLRGGLLPRGLLILGTYRSDEPDNEVAALRSHPGSLDLSLDRLDEAGVAAMVADMLALSPPPERFASLLARHSEGNPFFVAEYLHTAVAESVLLRQPGGQWVVAPGDDPEQALSDATVLPIPEPVRAILRRRLARLDTSAARLAEYASVLGREFEPDLLGELVGRDIALAGSLFALLHEHVLEETEEGRLRFVHDKIREIAYQSIPTQRRRNRHREVATTLTTRAVSDPRHLPTLGHHWEAAGELARAGAAYRDAARAEVRGLAFGAAAQLYRSALRLAEPRSAETVTLLNELGERVLVDRRHMTEVVEVHEQAVAAARTIRDEAAQAASLRLLGIAHAKSGDLDSARTCYREALALARRGGDRRLEAKLLAHLSIAQRIEGELEEAYELNRRSLELARAVGDGRQERVTLSNQAVVCDVMRRDGEAERTYAEVLTLARWAEDRAAEGLALRNYGSFLVERHRPEEGEELLQRGLRLSRELRNRQAECFTLSNLGYLHLSLNRLGQARPLFEASLAIAREIGEPVQEGFSLASLGSIEGLQGRLAAACDCLEHALARHREAGDRRHVGLDAGYLAGFRLAQGRIDDAIPLLDLAEEIHTEITNRRALGHVLSGRAQVARARGDVRAARELAERALDLHRETGDGAREGLTLVLLGEVEEDAGNPGAADRNFRDALTTGDDDSLASCTAALGLARLARRQEDLDTAVDWLSRAEATAGDNIVARALCHCERGRLALRSDRDARRQLQAAERLARLADVLPDSPLGRALQGLRDAMA